MTNNTTKQAATAGTMINGPPGPGKPSVKMSVVCWAICSETKRGDMSRIVRGAIATFAGINRTLGLFEMKLTDVFFFFRSVQWLWNYIVILLRKSGLTYLPSVTLGWAAGSGVLKCTFRAVLQIYPGFMEMHLRMLNMVDNGRFWVNFKHSISLTRLESVYKCLHFLASGG